MDFVLAVSYFDRCPLALSAVGPFLRSVVEESVPCGYDMKPHLRITAECSGRQIRSCEVRKGGAGGLLRVVWWWLERDTRPVSMRLHSLQVVTSFPSCTIELRIKKAETRALKAVLQDERIQRQLETLVVGEITGRLDFTLLSPFSRLVELEIRSSLFTVSNATALLSGHLTTLDLSHTNVTTIAGLLLRPNRHRRLTTLRLNQTRVESLAGLEGFTALRELYACQSALRDISALRSLPGLRVLNLSETAIADLEPLAHCPLLEEVMLSSCRHLTTVDPLAAVPALRCLTVDHTPVQNLPDTFGASHTLLEHISFNSCPFITTLAPLRGAVSLKTVSAVRGYVDTLGRFYVDSPRLEILRLLFCPIPKEEFEELRVANPNCMAY
ncbi:hypothetical protein AGDE_14187 [Angomonas deanei]|uniref:Uncharacterized protein n=1 Tax=Angomonas deanei TaxID=59799 RepID=A0A7G2CKQ2_9TRYP|nr:hypothetical protein AGDE_14187 [Angomonas deanei]CAD2219494.1 hypothetical protein, conserved [Angomonas deanei]|eukprot:EPY21292.1 hypothetical protein AGDE_14187 [Angomonas deanei]